VISTAFSWIQTWSTMAADVAPRRRPSRRPGPGPPSDLVVEDPGQQRADDAADAVDAEDVERVVGAEHLLQPVDAPEAGEAGDEADRRSRPSGRRCRTAGVIATRPATATDAAPSIDALPLNSASPIDQASTAAAVAEKVLMKASTAGLPAFERRAGIEAEPADPEQRRADHRQRQRVRRERFAAVAERLPIMKAPTRPATRR
jgi:hypothetical protein